jgi:hypothetical protein
VSNPADGVAVVEDRRVGVAETDAARVPVAETETETDGEPLVVAADGVLVAAVLVAAVEGVQPSATSSARCVKPHVPVGPCQARYIPSRAYTGAPWLLSLAGCHP